MKQIYFYNEDVCKNCGGRCCKTIPGIATTKDIKKLFKTQDLISAVKEALLSRKWAIDCVDRYENDYEKRCYLRPAINYNHGIGKMVEDIGCCFDFSWGGTCTFFTENGCELSSAERPDECRRLKPNPNFECGGVDSNIGRKYYAKIWKKSGINLYEIGKEVEKMLGFNGPS